MKTEPSVVKADWRFYESTEPSSPGGQTTTEAEAQGVLDAFMEDGTITLKEFDLAKEFAGWTETNGDAGARALVGAFLRQRDPLTGTVDGISHRERATFLEEKVGTIALPGPYGQELEASALPDAVREALIADAAESREGTPFADPRYVSFRDDAGRLIGYGAFLEYRGYDADGGGELIGYAPDGTRISDQFWYQNNDGD